MASLLAHYKSSDLSPGLRRSLAILGKGKTALETFLKRDRVAVRDHLLGEWLVTFKDQSVSLSYLCPSVSRNCHQYEPLAKLKCK